MNIINDSAHRCGTLLLGGVAAACLLFLPAARGADPMILTSASKQFVVRGVPQRSVFAASAKEDFIYLDPALLVVTCERVKQTLERELGWGNRWRGTVFVDVHPLRFDNEQPDLRVFRTSEGWRYRIDLPDEIDRTRLLETIIEALLLEFGNRMGTTGSIDLPPWLVEGLTAHLMEGALSGVALQANAMNVQHSARNDPAAAIRKRIQRTGTLTVDQLNWAEFDDADRASADTYHHSAHLFVRELLRLRGGRDALCAMVAMLPEHLNWQTAFLRGFEPHFHRMLDVEKWWSLSLARLKIHETSLTWSTIEAQRKLEEVLHTPMQVLTEREMPHVTPVDLQSVILDWDFQQQVSLLQAKLGQLQAVRLRLPPDFAALSDSYRVVIEKYLRVRAAAWLSATGRAATKEAVAQLKTLDAQRAKMSANVLAAAPPEVPLTPH
jgi:hypothetical protein